MSLGTVFISHKHKDKEIAKVVGDFMKDASGNRIDIYLSSDPRYKGTRAGEPLAQELDKAIAESGIVILVYTGKSAKVDWEYCIYECACAHSQGIRVIVLQCVDQAPAPFISTVRTLVTDKANIFKFTKDFLTSPDFLKDQKEKVTEYSPEDPAIKEKADVFHNKLTAAITKYLGQDPQQWSAWPSMRVRFSSASVGRLAQAQGAERCTVVREELLNQAEVVESAGADQIFGVGIDDGQSFESLVASWRESYDEQDPEWLDSICGQIEAFARKRYPVLRETRLAEVQGKSSVIPVVADMLSFPTRQEKEFDIKFYDMRSRSPNIKEIMIGKEKVYCKFVEPDGSSNLDLRKLYKDMKKRDINRLPILDKAWHVRYMVHRSVMSEYLLDADIDEPTLHDLVNMPELKDTFRSTIVFVSESSTVEEARDSLMEVDGARDVFVTKDGDRDAPILGMVTNTDLEQHV